MIQGGGHDTGLLALRLWRRRANLQILLMGGGWGDKPKKKFDAEELQLSAGGHIVKYQTTDFKIIFHYL